MQDKQDINGIKWGALKASKNKGSFIEKDSSLIFEQKDCFEENQKIIDWFNKYKKKSELDEEIMKEVI